jgi:voltage-gated sodium channel
MLNLFIAIIVNAMQHYSEVEHEDTMQAVQAAQQHIEADLHDEMRALRDEIRALQHLLSSRGADQTDEERITR